MRPIALKSFSLALIFIMMAAACQSTQGQATPTATEPAIDEAAVLEKATPMLENMLKALDQKDYETFKVNFDEKMKASATRESFDALQSTMAEKYGAYQSIKYEQMASAQGYLNVYYSAVFEKGTLTIQLVLNQNNTNEIAGLWFR
jgi:hypothetical protein